MKKIGIIGGGISGLTAAFLLKRKGFDVTVFEKTNRAGGNIQTIEVDGFTLEYAPNSLLKSPRLVDLIRELKLETEVVAADPNAKKRYVLQNGKLASLPMSVGSLIAGDFFSLKGKLRLLKEPFVRTRSTAGETVAGFFERRLGREIVEKAADPFISGIYAGNPEKLSIRAAFPRLFELERDFGSLLLGSLRSRAEKAEKADRDFPRTFSFAGGVQTLTRRLAEFLGDSVRTNASIRGIEKAAGRFFVETAAGREVFDALIISATSEAAASMLENMDAALGEKLKNISYAPVAMVFFGVKKESLKFRLDGFGFLVPGSEKRRILGTIWNSAVFANRAPAGYDLLTTFVGGARRADLFEKTDEELTEIVYEELKDILRLETRPDFTRVKRWPRAIPQYDVGHEKTERAIGEFSASHRGIFFCSNFYKGISVGDCVKNAYRTAAEAEEFLKDNRPPMK